MPAATAPETEVGRRIADAIQKVRRQKQRPTADRIRHMLDRCGDAVTSSEIDQLLDLAVSCGAIERIYNPSGVVSYKDNLGENSSSSIPVASEPFATAVTKTHLPAAKPKKSSKPSSNASTTLSPEPKPKKVSKLLGSVSTETRLPKLKPKRKKSESKKLETKKSNSSLPSKEPLKKSTKKSKPPPPQHSPPMQLSNVFHETVSADFKPTLVIDKHADLSDVVLQVILRLGSASGKALEKAIRSHYRLDIYPGSDIRRLIRSACKSLVRQEQLRQDGNSFVLCGDDDDAADVTLTVDEPDVDAENMSIDTQVQFVPSSVQ